MGGEGVADNAVNSQLKIDKTMYDNSIHKMAQPSLHHQHIEYAHQVVSSISELPLDQQNEVLLTVFKAVKERRKNEVSELMLRNEEINERRILIQNTEERLQKEMDGLRVSESPIRL